VKDKTVAVRRDLVKLVPMDGKGRGVVATRRIPRNTLIEAAPVIRMKPRDELTRETVLSSYPFQWNDPPYTQCFALGWVELLNHSDEPNCRCETDFEAQVLRVFTLRDIRRGEELCHNYGIDPWFKVVK
jgi:SET domain-containing protein